MAHFTVRRTLFLSLSVLTCLALLFGVGGVRLARPAEPDNAHALKAPPFLSVAYAQDAAPEAALASIFDNEAGIAAYFQSPDSINLATVAPLYRTIETQTAQYIIGSIHVPNYPEWEDVHLYVHTSGWVMAYYLKGDPVGRIFDWRGYTGGTIIPTRLENVLGIVVSQIGIAQPTMTFYHFQYPNATHMLLVADQAPDATTDSFQVNPTSAYGYFERSWSLGCFGSQCNYQLDGTELDWNNSNETSQGFLTPSQLVLDAFHTIAITNVAYPADAGLALIYRVP
jgi:hypothetical protein